MKAPRTHEATAFSLVELLVVIAVIAVMTALAVPAFNSVRGAGSLAKAASDISGTLQQARSYAMSQNTYVYVGLQEVDVIQPTTTDGTGRVVIAAVASKSGTRPANVASESVAISKAQSLDGAHMTNAAALAADGGMADRESNLTDLSLPASASASQFQFTWPLGGTAKYRFAKVIEFDPQGVARLQTNAGGGSQVEHGIEIALFPARGNTAAATDANQASIQINGITGAVRIFRP
ncbi:MAG: prepilin-type N-terminal cleavage/methylation domain-containing protein [Verrucomicrobiota bacterium]